jgi:hypothetical protein
MLVIWWLGSAVSAVFLVPWTAELRHERRGWLMPLGMHSLWWTPTAPDYAEFRAYCNNSPNFPNRDDDWSIHTGYNKTMWFLTVVYRFWLGTFLCSLVYLVVRRSQRDHVLHYALWVSFCLFVICFVGFVFWIIVGFWWRPLPYLCVTLGLIAGRVIARRTFSKSV